MSGTLNCFGSFKTQVFRFGYHHPQVKPISCCIFINAIPRISRSSSSSIFCSQRYFAPTAPPPHISRHGIACQCEEIPFSTVRNRIDGRKNAKALHGLVITTDLTRSSVAISLHSRSKSILIVEMAAAQLLQDIDGVRNCFRAEEVIYLLLQFLPTTSD